MAETASLPCSACGKSRSMKTTAKGEPRLPRGWKRLGPQTLCDKCWTARYVLRSILLPVASPVDRTWEEFRGALTRCWEQSTALFNWAVTELAKADVVRQPGDTQLARMPRVYLYPRARQCFPDLEPNTLASILHTVESLYRRSRLDVVWRNQASLPRFRYPVPFPVNAQCWRPSFGDNGEPLLSIRLAGERWTLRLRGGPQYRYPLALFTDLVNGEALQAEAAVYRQRASTGDHRPAVEEREPAGGRRVRYRTIAKLVVWSPRKAGQQERKGQMEVQTSARHFWVAVIPGQEPWVLNADHVRRWQVQHSKFLHRLSQDGKYEKQWPARNRRHMEDARQVRCDLHRRRMHTFCHQATAMLANYAARRRVAEVVYDDRDQSFTAEFPWSELRRLLSVKLDEKGIRLRVVEGPTLPEGATDEGDEGDGSA
jgi:hypothetical protein